MPQIEITTMLERLKTLVIVLFAVLPLHAAPEPDCIRFLAYNVKNYLEMERVEKEGTITLLPKPDHEISALVEVIAAAKPDIIGLCEIGTQNDLNELRQHLATAGMKFKHQLIVEGADPHRHLALLSRFPITSHPVTPVPDFPIANTRLKISRGILDATVIIEPGIEIRLIGVHLKSKREVPHFDQVEIRNNEALLVRNHITRTLQSAPDTHLLVYGDFNDTKESTAVNMIRDAGPHPRMLTDLRLKDSRGHTWTHFWNQNDIYSRLDYVLVTKELRRRVIMADSRIIDHPATTTASDHRPLLVTIETEKL